MNASRERDVTEPHRTATTARIRLRICSGRLVVIIASMISGPHSSNSEAIVGEALSRSRNEERSELSLIINKRIGLGSLENGSCWTMFARKVELL